jgi:hypothetical protein
VQKYALVVLSIGSHILFRTGALNSWRRPCIYTICGPPVYTIGWPPKINLLELEFCLFLLLWGLHSILQPKRYRTPANGSADLRNPPPLGSGAKRANKTFRKRTMWLLKIAFQSSHTPHSHHFQCWLLRWVVIKLSTSPKLHQPRRFHLQTLGTWAVSGSNHKSCVLRS